MSEQNPDLYMYEVEILDPEAEYLKRKEEFDRAMEVVMRRLHEKQEQEKEKED